MGYEIRATRPDEWRRSRDLRLAALQDPVGSTAFVNTYETEAAFSDDIWQRRGDTPCFIAVDDAGQWVGTVTVLIEAGADFVVPQTHVVGVYVRPDHRGSGLADSLMRSAIEWSFALPEKIDRVRLWVHEDNARARAFYRRLGFTKTGQTMAYPLNEAQTEYEMELSRGCRGAVAG